MPKETMLLTDALTAVKNLDSKIQQKTGQAIFIAVSEGDAKVPTNKQFKTADEVEKQIKADHQSILDMIKRRSAIRVAIQNTNVTTKVKVGDQEMTIAEAVEKKNTLNHQNYLLSVMQQHMSKAAQVVDTKTAELNKKIDAIVHASFQQGTKPNEDQVKMVQETTHKQQYSQYGPALVDPLSLRETINKLQDSTEAFAEKVDTALSVVNATTTIEVEY